ncbi:MAG: TRIC cation channel family protein [Granulosicoccus sp.]|nr:TRIC cation channel family protein [Granulosicoccus sp.]
MLLLDLLSTHCFACFGALVALKARMKIWQVLVASMLTATGGGTVREIVLASELLFWLDNLAYLIAVGLALPLAMLLVKVPEIPPALGRATVSAGTTIFIVVGALAALHSGCELPGVVIAGLCTGIGGGVLRQCILERGFDVYRNSVDFAAALVTAVVSAWLIVGGMDPVLCVLLLCVHHFVLLKLLEQIYPNHGNLMET